MQIAQQLFLVLHIVGIASLLGGFLTQLSALRTGAARVTSAFFHGALTMLVTGLALVGLAEMADDAPVNHPKVAVKLVVLLAILALVWIQRRREQTSPGVFGLIGGLTTLNVVIAVMWT